MMQQSKKNVKETKMGLVNPSLLLQLLWFFCLPHIRERGEWGEGNRELQLHRM